MIKALNDSYYDLFKSHFDLKESSQFLCVIDKGGHYVYTSSSTENVRGFCSKDFLGKHYDLFVHAEDIKLIEQCLGKISDLTSKIEEIQYRVRDKFDSWRSVRTSFTGATVNGEFVFVCVSYDISEAEKTRNALLSQRKLSLQYQNVLDSMAIVSITDTSGVITYVNDRDCKLSQYKRSELIGKNLRILNSGQHSKEFFASLWATLLCGDSWAGEVCNRAKDGSLYWVDTRIIPIFDENDKVYQYMTIRFDITEKKIRKEAEEEERTNRLMISKLVTLGEMAATLAHEINNPLTVIQHFSKKLSKSGNHFVRKQAEKINNSSKRISDIMHGLKLVSRNTQGDEKEWFCLNELVDKTVGFCNYRFTNACINFEAEHLSDEVQIYGKISDLSQVLLNIINNATDAIEEQRASWIRVSYELSTEDIKIIITDSGSGIPLLEREKIMAPFYTTKRMGKGTGLGLSMSQKIVNEHNGKLFIDGESKNTCFIIELPIKLSNTLARSA